MDQEPGSPSEQHRDERPHHRETILQSQRLEIERKQFLVILAENHSGRFLRIVEQGRERHSLVVPASGLSEFVDKFRAALQPEDPV